MELLKKTISGLEKVVGRKIQYATEEKGLKTEGKTIFHFAFQGHNYVGAVEGEDEQAVAFAALFPAQLEGDSPQRNALTRSQFFQKILQGEGTNLQSG